MESARTLEEALATVSRPLTAVPVPVPVPVPDPKLCLSALRESVARALENIAACA